jgi:hypothetical protein
MSIFCLLWIPVFFLFRRSISGVKTGMGWWALLPGSAAVFLYYLTGPFIAPVGFGLSRWLGGFIDIVSLPVLVPIVFCVLMAALRLFPSDVDIGGFTLLWLVPLAFYYSVDKYLLYSPLMLVLVPLLWTAQALGVSFFIGCILMYRRWYVIVPSILSAAALPLIASSSWWAFYSQRMTAGCLSLFISMAPALVSLFFYYAKARRNTF